MIQEIPAKEPNIGYVLFQAVEKKKSYWGKSLLQEVLWEHPERKFYSERRWNISLNQSMGIWPF